MNDIEKLNYEKDEEIYLLAINAIMRSLLIKEVYVHVGLNKFVNKNLGAMGKIMYLKRDKLKEILSPKSYEITANMCGFSELAKYDDGSSSLHNSVLEMKEEKH